VLFRSELADAEDERRELMQRIAAAKAGS